MTLTELKKLAESATPEKMGAYHRHESANEIYDFIDAFNPQTALKLIECIEVMRDGLNCIARFTHNKSNPDCVPAAPIYECGCYDIDQWEIADDTLAAVDRLLEGE